MHVPMEAVLTTAEPVMDYSTYMYMYNIPYRKDSSQPVSIGQARRLSCTDMYMYIMYIMYSMLHV